MTAENEPQSAGLDPDALDELKKDKHTGEEINSIKVTIEELREALKTNPRPRPKGACVLTAGQ